MTRQEIKVKDVYDPKMLHSEIVKPKESLDQVIRKFAKKAGLRGLFVVDNEGKLMGVVTRIDLLNFVKLRLGGRLRLDDIKKGRLGLGDHVFASKVEDIIHPYSWRVGLKPDDSIFRALDLMVEHDLIDVPVVDDEGRILGDLKLSEVMLKILE